MMVAEKPISEAILEVFEEQEEAFHFPVSTQKDARAFVKALHGKGIDYDAICDAIGEFEPNFCSWRKGLGRQGIGKAIIELINEPFQDVLFSDEEDGSEKSESEKSEKSEKNSATDVTLRQDVVSRNEKLRHSRIEQLREEAAVLLPKTTDADSTDSATDVSSEVSTDISTDVSREPSEEKTSSDDIDIDALAEQENELEKKEVEKVDEKNGKEESKFDKKIELKPRSEFKPKKVKIEPDSEPKIEVKPESKSEVKPEPQSKASDDKISVSPDSSSIVEMEITESYDSDLDLECVDPNSDKATLLRQVSSFKSEENSNGAGYLYIFTDSSKFASRPRLKIGCSRFPQKRLEQAMKFNPDLRLVQSSSVTQRQSALESVCIQLKPYRIDGLDEWFKAPLDKAVRIVEETAKIFVEDEAQAETDESLC